MTANIKTQEIHGFCIKSVAAPLKLVVSDAAGDIPCWEYDLEQPICLVIGSEADGVSKQLVENSHARIHIPMGTDSESFNASVAAGILIYEVMRQRKIS